MISVGKGKVMITPDHNIIKPIAIVLPQFHPIRENNLWWGEGFTEWTNVVKGRPRFRGHYQPHLPKDLGYYDLRLPETRKAQAALATKYGIYGFCYYHYWFNGRRILESPVDAMLESVEPDFPFMLCWANENWTRNWDGSCNKVLLEQKYSKEDFVNHARHLIRYFKDDRYIKIDGRPVFAIYKDDIGEDIEKYLDLFRNELLKNSINVFLCRFERNIGTSRDLNRAFQVFDAGIEFQPLARQFSYLMDYNNRLSRRIYKMLKKHFCFCKNIDDVYIYSRLVDNDLKYDFQQGWPIFPGVCPGWDNSARRRDTKAIIFDKSTPEIFKLWVREKIRITDWNLLPERFLFVNAWNEWAEGNHLEPCEKWGTQYLAALLAGINEM